MNARHLLATLALVGCQRASATTDTTSSTATTAAATATATVTASATASAPSGRTYAIRFERALRVGGKTHMTVDDERNDRTTAEVAGKRKDENKVVRTHIDGDVILLELTADGKKPLHEEMTVADFSQSKDEAAQTPVAHAGAKISVTRAPNKRDARVTVDGAAANATVRSALERVSSLTLHSGPTDDDVFGTGTPRAVGEEWSVNAALAEKDLADRGIVVEKGSVSGKAKLAGMRTVDGVDCLDVEVNIHVGALRSIAEMPPGSSVTNGTIDVVMHATLPVDSAKTTTPQSDMRITMKGAFSLPSAKGNVLVTLDSVDYKKIASR